MDRRAFLVSVAALSGCTGYFEQDEREGVTDPDDVVVIWDTLVREDAGTEDERVEIWGVVRNESERELGYVEIRARFYDADGEELDSVITNVEDVTEGREWPFEIEFQHFGDRAAAVQSYELEVITSL